MNQLFYIELAARCDAAGRPENEDNFQVAEDLSVSNFGFSKEQIPLGNKGAMLAVCDGMGGMNAGEVASAIAVETIKQRFAKENLSDEILSSDENICQFVRETIIQADKDIKSEAAQDREKTGMGSTAVLLWLLGDRAYAGWCGDSRIYRYRPQEGLTRLSHDHSYVQELVDTGELLPELAFDHPNKNIITRSLGDVRKTANPDVLIYDIQDGDIFLLCSDGLHDALRDNEIEQCIRDHQDSMQECRDSLWETSREAGWMDNVTVVVAKISSTPKPPKPEPKPEPAPHPAGGFDATAEVSPKPIFPWKKYLVAGLAALAIIILGIRFLKGMSADKSNETETDQYASKGDLDDAWDKYFDPEDNQTKFEKFLDIFKKYASNPDIALGKLDTLCSDYYKALNTRGDRIKKLKKTYDEVKRTRTNSN